MSKGGEAVNLHLAEERERVSGNTFKGVFKEMEGPLTEEWAERTKELLAAQAEPLHPDLTGWVEEHETFGKILRHPLVYDLGLTLPGQTNRIYIQRKAELAEAIEDCDWGTAVFTHERPYRMRALIDYVTGRYDQDDDGPVIPLDALSDAVRTDDLLGLVADVWVDSENIGQHIEDWRALFGEARRFFLGTYTEQLAFAALPDPIHAYRAGIDDGDWSWTTDRSIAEFFARRFDDPPVPVMEAWISKADCFGYLTRRSESELLVRLDAEYTAMVVSGNEGGQ